MSNRKLYFGVLLALMVFFAIYTATNFPYTYITMEGDGFWVLTWGFWQLKLSMLPAFTNWLADFLIQFYGSPYIAATTHALVLGLIGTFAHAVLSPLLGKGWWRFLALLPPIILGFFCTFDLSFQLQWLFFFALLLAYQKTSSYFPPLLWSILSVLLGFFLMRTPMLFLLLLLQVAIVLRNFNWKGCLYFILPLLLLALTPLIYSQQIAFIPFEERYTAWGTHFDPLTSRYNIGKENVKKYVCLANKGRWEDLLYREHAKRDALRGNETALRYALLAESALGTLPDNLMEYPIRNENQFLFPHQTEYVASQFNRLFYLNLGVYDEAFHHAEEYGLLQTNGNCFSSLRQMSDYSIEEGDFEVAEKFLQILSKSSCHKEFVKERRERMKKEELRIKNLIPNPYSLIQLRADNFVGGYPLPVEMLRLARYYDDKEAKSSNCQIKKMLDYAICSYMLRGDVNSFLIATKAFDIYKDKALPKAYQEFMSK